MAMITGETYRCPNQNCGCEVKVTQGAKAGGGGESPPRCWLWYGDEEGVTSLCSDSSTGSNPPFIIHWLGFGSDRR
jgi:hypothetical protein